MGDMLVLCF